MLAQFEHLRPPIPQTIEEKKVEFSHALGIIRRGVYGKFGGNGLSLSNISIGRVDRSAIFRYGAGKVHFLCHKAKKMLEASSGNTPPS